MQDRWAMRREKEMLVNVVKTNRELMEEKKW